MSYLKRSTRLGKKQVNILGYAYTSYSDIIILSHKFNNEIFIAQNKYKAYNAGEHQNKFTTISQSEKLVLQTNLRNRGEKKNL